MLCYVMLCYVKWKTLQAARGNLIVCYYLIITYKCSTKTYIILVQQTRNTNKQTNKQWLTAVVGRCTDSHLCQEGYVFACVCLFVCLLTGLLNNY